MRRELCRQSNSLAGRAPQAQVEPAGLAFSSVARAQVHSPAGRAPGCVIRVSVVTVVG